MAFLALALAPVAVSAAPRLGMVRVTRVRFANTARNRRRRQEISCSVERRDVRRTGAARRCGSRGCERGDAAGTALGTRHERAGAGECAVSTQTARTPAPPRFFSSGNARAATDAEISSRDDFRRFRSGPPRGETFSHPPSSVPPGRASRVRFHDDETTARHDPRFHYWYKVSIHSKRPPHTRGFPDPSSPPPFPRLPSFPFRFPLRALLTRRRTRATCPATSEPS